MLYIVLRQGQSVFGRKDIYRNLSNAKQKADKINGVVKQNGIVIYAS